MPASKGAGRVEWTNVDLILKNRKRKKECRFYKLQVFELHFNTRRDDRIDIEWFEISKFLKKEIVNSICFKLKVTIKFTRERIGAFLLKSRINTCYLG